MEPAVNTKFATAGQATGGRNPYSPACLWTTHDRTARQKRRRPARTPKGRQIDPRALDEVRALLGDGRAGAIS